MNKIEVIDEIRELVNSTPLTYIDIQPIIEKYSAEKDMTLQVIIRGELYHILKDLKNENEIEYMEDRASQALMTTTQNAFPSDSLFIKSTLSYEKERNKPAPQPTFYNTGQIINSPMNNPHSDFSKAFANPTTNIQSTQNAHSKKRRSFLEILAWIAGILAFISGILIYFKVWPFNQP